MARRVPAPTPLGRMRFFASMSSTELNKTLSSPRGALFGLAILAILITAQTARGGDAEALAKQAQNPISDLITVPIEENLSFGNLDGETQHVVNVSPVYPLELNDEWLLINRAIIPAAIYLPSSVTGSGSEFGFGDINFTTFLSPRKSTGSFFCCHCRWRVWSWRNTGAGYF
jgi:hypothetical protein